MVSMTPPSDAACLEFRPGGSGRRAFFMAEARTPKEARALDDIFHTLGQLADVVRLASGPVMSYAVQLNPEVANLDLFGKIERMLVARFSFTVVEREVTDVTLHLARTLCEEAEGEVADLPECDICDAADPFPTRGTIVWADGFSAPEHFAFCRRCTERHGHLEPAEQARTLLEQAGRGYRLAADVPVVVIDDAEGEDDRLAQTG